MFSIVNYDVYQMSDDLTMNSDANLKLLERM